MVRGTIIYQRSPETVLKELRARAKAVLKGVGEKWYWEFLPRHFQADAMTRYGYPARDAAYVRRKLRQKGHQRPFVWSGETEQMMRREARISSTSKGVTVKMRAPWYVRLKNRFQDLTQINQKEITELAQAHHRGVTRRLNAARKPERKVMR